MTDDRPLKEPADTSHVQLQDAEAIDYWTNRFHTTRERLEEAIEHAGTQAADVERWLEQHPQLHVPAGKPGQ